ncbi:MAG: Hpt domain-containing protein [bacterium]
MSDEIVVYVDADLEDLTPEFLENRQKDIVEITRLVEVADFTEIQRLGHSMKGSGGGYGFEEISEIGKDLEEAAKRSDRDSVIKLNNRLAKYLSAVKVVYQEED